MKLTWIRKLQNDTEWKNFTVLLYPRLVSLEKFGSEYAHTAMQKIDNLFWKDVLKHYRKLYTKCFIDTIDDFMNDCIHYNLNILRDKKVVYLKEWVDTGILFIRHLVNPDGNYMSFCEFKKCYPTIHITSFVTYAGVLNAVKQYQSKLNVVLTSHYKTREGKVWQSIHKGNKYVQSVLTNSGAPPAAVGKWNQYYEGLNWKIIFGACFASTSDVQLRWFQSRLLHRILPTQKYLHTFRIVDSPICNFCVNDCQTLSHLFWECDFVNSFWNELLLFLHDKCPHTAQFNFDENLILFGVSEGIITDRVIDFLIIFAKFYIYKCKLQNTIPQVHTFFKTLKTRYNTELYCSKITNNYHNFNQQWSQFYPLVTD